MGKMGLGLGSSQGHTGKDQAWPTGLALRKKEGLLGKRWGGNSRTHTYMSSCTSLGPVNEGSDSLLPPCSRFLGEILYGAVVTLEGRVNCVWRPPGTPCQCPPAS